jgi:hypothetical protein
MLHALGRDSKIGQQDMALVLEQDITWLDVSMNQALLMGIVNRFAKLQQERSDALDGQ